MHTALPAPPALLDLPTIEARARIADADAVWVPVNPVEYHGPHLPLHTDRLQAEAWMADLHRALGHTGTHPLAVADLELGVDPAPGPGSRGAPFAEVRRSVIRTCAGLAELGAKRIVLVTFHGAPLHNLALHHAVRWLEARGVRAAAPFQEAIRMLGAMQGPDVDAALAELPDDVRAAVRADLDLDFHAGFLETSLMLHWAPAAVAPIHRALPPCPPLPPIGALRALASVARAAGAAELAREMAFAAVAGGWTSLRPFPGYTGNPALASAAAGRVFADALVRYVTPVVARALSGEAPQSVPPFRWLAPLTAWGRLGPPHPGPDEVLSPG